MRIHDRVAFGSSLWRRFARCVARSVIVVAGKFASILICGVDYSSCVTHSHNLNSDTRNENVDQPLFHKQKCRNIFFLVRNERRGFFFRKPPAFHRLPFMPSFAGDVGAGAGSLKRIAQIPRKAYRWSLRGDSKKIFRPRMWETKSSKNSFSCPHKTRTARGAPCDSDTKRPRKKKEQVRSGERLSDRAPDF